MKFIQITIAVLSLLATTGVYAQTTPDELGKLLAEREKSLKNMGDKDFTRSFNKARGVVSQIVTEQDAAQEKQKSQDQLLQMSTENIKGHYRTKNGVAFPPESEVVRPEVKLPTEEEVFQMMQRDAGHASPYPTPDARAVPRCSRDVTTEEQLNLSEPIGVPLDLLYLPADDLPDEPDDVFGEGVNLYPFKAGDEVAYQVMHAVNVPCVPFRYRIYGKTIYRDFGLNAYRNYSKNQGGRGEAHPWLQQQFGVR